METININRKKYIVIEQTAFEKIQTVAALKTIPQKKLSLKDGKKLAYQLINKWAKEK
jgi:hypothetical protein